MSFYSKQFKKRKSTIDFLSKYIYILEVLEKGRKLRLKGILVVAAGLTTLSCFTINAKAAAIDNYANANNTEIGGSVDIVNDGLNNSKSNIFTDEYRILLQKKSLKNLKIKNKASESYITSKINSPFEERGF